MDEAILKRIKGEAAVKALRKQPTWAELEKLRKASPDSEQVALAPAEHQAYAREMVEKHPLWGGPFLMAGIPGYQIAKALKVLPVEHDTTPPSLEQAAAGYTGMQEGYTNVLDKLRGRMLPGLK